MLMETSVLTENEVRQLYLVCMKAREEVRDLQGALRMKNRDLEALAQNYRVLADNCRSLHQACRSLFKVADQSSLLFLLLILLLLGKWLLYPLLLAGL